LITYKDRFYLTLWNPDIFQTHCWRQYWIFTHKTKYWYNLPTNYQNRQKLIKEYAKIALFHLHYLMYI